MACRGPQPQGVTCPPPNPQFKYVYLADVKPYFDLAEQYVFGDRMFATPQGPSFPAHQYLYCRRTNAIRKPAGKCP
jgi:phospholipase C